MRELSTFYPAEEAARCGVLPALLALCAEQRTWAEGHQLLEAARAGIMRLFGGAELFPVQVAGG